MNRIKRTFDQILGQNKKALITFVTCGDPSVESTVKIVDEMVKNGSDIIELGVPYSDPIAEGPVIQRANQRALKNGINIDKIFETVKEIRKTIDVPILLLLYYNCIFKYGAEKFLKNCSDSGIDGLIIPDLPFEEQDEINDTADANNIDLITLVAPTSKYRVEKIVKNSKGFLYCVSSLGVTGIRNDFETDFKEFFEIIDKHAKIPTAIGFGISNTEHIKQLKNFSDGLIVGSAIVKIIEENNEDINKILKNVGAFIRELRIALDE